MRVIKKPIAVKAEIYKLGMEDGFIDGKPYIETLEGKHFIGKGDYVITGVKGERYPIKPDIFKETYSILK